MTEKTRREGSCLLALVLMVFSLSGVACAGAQELSASDVEKEIDRLGAGPALARLTEEPERWSAALTEIARGRTGWIDVAAKLREASDAGSSEELDLAVAEALEHEPEKVLAVLGHPFEIVLVCGNVESIGVSYHDAVATLERRSSAVQAVREGTPQKKECLVALEELAAAVRENRHRWFRE